MLFDININILMVPAVALNKCASETLTYFLLIFCHGSSSKYIDSNRFRYRSKNNKKRRQQYIGLGVAL